MRAPILIAGAVSLVVLGVLALAGGSSRPRPKGEPPKGEPSEPAGGPVTEYVPGESVGVWSLGTGQGTWCTQPIIPVCTAEFGARVLEVPGEGLVWGWTPPGDLRAARKYGPRLIADVEMRSSTKAKPSAGWAGSELEEARALAPLVHGVTSHGYVAASLRGVLGVFADADCVAYPQVYDSDRSTEPRKFLRNCIDSYDRAGFRYIVPLLGASAGADYLREWIDECRKIGVPYSLWSLQRLADRKIRCADLET